MSGSLSTVSISSISYRPVRLGETLLRASLSAGALYLTSICLSVHVCHHLSTAVDFFNEVSLLYGVVADDTERFSKPGEGFPPGFEYLWVPEAKPGGRKPAPQKCSAPQYVDHVMTWVEDQINNEAVSRRYHRELRL